MSNLKLAIFAIVFSTLSQTSYAQQNSGRNVWLNQTNTNIQLQRESEVGHNIVVGTTTDCPPPTTDPLSDSQQICSIENIEEYVTDYRTFANFTLNVGELPDPNLKLDETIYVALHGEDYYFSSVKSQNNFFILVEPTTYEIDSHHNINGVFNLKFLPLNYFDNLVPDITEFKFDKGYLTAKIPNNRLSATFYLEVTQQRRVFSDKTIFAKYLKQTDFELAPLDEQYSILKINTSKLKLRGSLKNKIKFDLRMDYEFPEILNQKKLPNGTYKHSLVVNF